MTLFILVYVAIYGAINFYMFWKLRQGLPLGHWQWVLAGFLAIMVIGPVFVRTIERWALIRTAGVIGVFLFSWLAISFWFFSSGVVMDAWNLGARLLGNAVPGAAKWVISARAELVVMAVVVAGALAWSLVEAQAIGLTHLTVKAPQLPKGSKPIRIVQVSDLHLGGGTGARRLEKTIELVKEAKPDLLLLTGDIIDEPYDLLGDYSKSLKTVEAPLGKFAIPGNHEYYTGIGDAIKFHQAAGFRFMRQESVDVTPELYMVGIDYARQLATEPAEASLLTADRQKKFTLMLKHLPDIDPESLGKFDLQLSGHTHGGQIFPFMVVTRAHFKYWRGRYDLGEGSSLYVSRGTGTWGPPMRLLSPPEIVVITLEPPEK